MLSAKSITYRVDGQTLLSDVSLQLAPGKMNLIIGPNGSGKSTLVKILSGQIKKYTGQVLYGDKNIHAFKEPQLARFRAVLSQSVEIAFPLKVSEVVMMGRYPHFNSSPGHADKQACLDALTLFDIADMAGRDFMSLSGGEKQRVHFARVVAQIWYPIGNEPRYLLLDEPLTFLDIHYQLDFIHKISDMMKRENIVVAGVVHDLNLVIKYADMVTLLFQGSVLAHGNKTEVLTRENIQSAFRIDTEIVRDEIRQSDFIVF